MDAGGKDTRTGCEGTVPWAMDVGLDRTRCCICKTELVDTHQVDAFDKDSERSIGHHSGVGLPVYHGAILRTGSRDGKRLS